ncbi:MAG: hypothetical protein R3E53_14160 [Myxococcota bacterium]
MDGSAGSPTTAGKHARAASTTGGHMADKMGDPIEMETLLREAKERHNEIPATLKEDIVLEHTP